MTTVTTGTVAWVRWRIRKQPTKWHARTSDYGLRCLPDDKQLHDDEERSDTQPDTADCCARCLRGDGLGIELRDSSRDSLRPWQRHKLIRELALGERTSADLSREYGLTASGIRDFKSRHRAEVDAITSAAADEFAGLWIADKGQRIASHQADYEMALDSDRADHHEWLKARTQILHTVAEELGQLPPRTQIAVLPVVHIVESVDLSALT